MEGRSRLFLIMRDSVYRYCLYRIAAPDIDEDESTVCQLEKPLYQFGESDFPDCMSFTAVGSSIYMVGGFSPKGADPTCPSNKTFIYDTLTDTLAEGPLLNAGKSCPLLFTIGAKIYAISNFIDRDEFETRGIDPRPQFEVLDTEQVGGMWCALPVPKLRVSRPRKHYSIHACTTAYVGHGASGVIFINFVHAGTYAFEVEKKLWSYVGTEKLPFSGYPIVIPPPPNCPSLCCTSLFKPAYRIRYYSKDDDNDNKVLQVDKYAIDDSAINSSSLPPRTFHDWSLTAFDRAGRAYYVTGGIDDLLCSNYHTGDRYVKVSVFDIYKDYGKLALESGEKMLEKGKEVKLELNQGQILKRCSNKKRELGIGEDDDVDVDVGEDETVKFEQKQTQVLKRCSNKKRELGIGEDDDVDVGEDETVKFEGKQTQVLKRCNKKRREMESGEEEDGTIKLKITPLWRRCFFGGPMCDDCEHVTAAFAM